MKKKYIKIDGIFCNHCRNKIINALLKVENIKKVNLDKNIAEITYDEIIEDSKIVKIIIELGYFTNLNMISNSKKKHRDIYEIFLIVILVIIITYILNKILGFNIFNVIPVVEKNMTYGLLFITGIFTSFHCISMCGAINLVATNSNDKSIIKPLLYNLGRLTSYTVLGGIIGLLGSVFNINKYFQSSIIIFSSILMFLYALNMLDFIKLKLNYRFKGPNLKTRSSFIIGLLNGFMPCGPLQTMQIYALGTGSWLIGALSMFMFALGTIPLMFLIGLISNLFQVKYKKIVNKIFTALIILLSFTMFNRGLLGIGIDITDLFKTNYNNYIKSEIKEDYQYIKIDLDYNGYKDIIVQKDIPVKLLIYAKKSKLNGCNNYVKFNNFNVEKELLVGENIIEFTPNETGTYTYTCWMNMLKNKIIVVEDLKGIK